MLRVWFLSGVFVAAADTRCSGSGFRPRLKIHCSWASLCCWFSFVYLFVCFFPKLVTSLWFYSLAKSGSARLFQWRCTTWDGSWVRTRFSVPREAVVLSLTPDAPGHIFSFEPAEMSISRKGVQVFCQKPVAQSETYWVSPHSQIWDVDSLMSLSVLGGPSWVSLPTFLPP